jgi:hypothetical protein
LPQLSYKITKKVKIKLSEALLIQDLLG